MADSSPSKGSAGALPDLGSRIAWVAGLYGSKQQAAEIAGISRGQLSRYESSSNEPNFSALARLAHGKGVSLDWLATGVGEPEAPFAPVDGERLARAIAVVDEALALRSRDASHEAKGRLTAAAYLMQNTDGEPAPLTASTVSHLSKTAT